MEDVFFEFFDLFVDGCEGWFIGFDYCIEDGVGEMIGVVND